MSTMNNPGLSKYDLSLTAIGELKILSASVLQLASSGERLEAISPPGNSSAFDALRKDVAAIRKVVDGQTHCVLVGGAGAGTIAEFKAQTWVFGNLFGDPMIQNATENRIIEVYDRGGKTIEEGARYHQTRQGAYVHNDGVSDPLPIDYLVLACGQKAKLGGESILVDAGAVYSVLKGFPQILECLMQDFWFENRGMSELESLFKAPIVSLSETGEPLIRYFRVYIESAHRKAGEPISPLQKDALDFLDIVLDQSTVQRRVMMEPGQILVSADDRFLHTRTSFIDRVPAPERLAGDELLDAGNRYMLRMWIRKKESSRTPNLNDLSTA